jgi:molecular chaperone GrpE
MAMPKDVTRLGRDVEGGAVRSSWACGVFDRLRTLMIGLRHPRAHEEPSPTVGSTSGLTVAELIAGGHVPEAVVEHLRSESERARVAQEAMLRTIADGEDVRRRLTERHEQAVRFANEDLLKAMLPVLDNLELCLQHSDSGTTTPLREAMEMTLRQWHDVFEKAGAVRIRAERGGEFDPAIHEAVMQEPDAELPNGSIARIVQPGFLLHERVLRPARLSLSTGIPDIEAEEETEKPDHVSVRAQGADEPGVAGQGLEPRATHGVEELDAAGQAQRGRSGEAEASSGAQTPTKEQSVRAASRAKGKTGAKPRKSTRRRRRSKGRGVSRR